MEKLLVGTIVDAFSLDGTLRVFSSTYLQDLRYEEGNTLLLKKGDIEINVIVESFRTSGKFDFVKFKEINSNEEATKYKGYDILVEKDISILDEGYYYFSDLVGCTIESEGRELGFVKVVEEFPAQITLRVKSKEGKDFFVPFVKAFIKEVDISKKKITINYIEGLI